MKNTQASLTVASIMVLALGGAVAAQPTANPSAQSGGAAAPTSSAGTIDKGRQLFMDSGCGNCHALADAGASGRVGPSLDSNANLSEDYVKQKIANGGGPMPAFAGQLSEEEIGAVSAYVMHVSLK